MNTDDIGEYVAALRASSDRARYALFVVIVATVLMFVATHNVNETSWPRRRLDAWYKYTNAASPGVKQPSEIARGDPQRLKDIREEYIKQFAARAVFTTSPIPGVSIDINDLGRIGGITLALLMIVMLACLAREHENLYLALFKVRRLCSEEKAAASDAGSRSNLLYHALAMTQVLNTPPTLARWRRNAASSIFRIVFVAPAIIYGWVVITEWSSRDIAAAYGVNTTSTVYAETFLAVLLFSLGLLSWFHSSAMAERWERAFFHINPSRAVAPQMSMRKWLRLRLCHKADYEIERDRLTSALVTSLTCSADGGTAELEIGALTINCENHNISVRELNQAYDALKKAGLAALSSSYGERVHQIELLRFSVAQSRLIGSLWTISGTWTFRQLG